MKITIIEMSSTKVKEKEKRKMASFDDDKQHKTIKSTHANSTTITKEKRK